MCVVLGEVRVVLGRRQPAPLLAKRRLLLYVLFFSVCVVHVGGVTDVGRVGVDVVLHKLVKIDDDQLTVEVRVAFVFFRLARVLGRVVPFK